MYEKLIAFIGRYFLYSLLFSLPFLAIFFSDIMTKKATFTFWIASFIPQVLTFLCLCYKYRLFGNLRKCLITSFTFNSKMFILIMTFSFGIPISVILINNEIIKSIDINFNVNLYYLKNLPIIFLLTFLSAFIEELIFRFIPYELLPKDVKYKSLFIINSIFCSAHLFNPNFSVIGLFSVLFAGVLLTIIYIKTSNILYSTLVHTFWNFIIGPILGGNVSGITTGGVFSYKTLKSDFLSGGNYGMEGSIISLIILLVFIILWKKNLLTMTKYP
ncbi:hypothetical protein CMU69_14165 [Elizabethkingia anophelis]|nr:hypothetical protein [Elizabethkingia anophelis]